MTDSHNLGAPAPKQEIPLGTPHPEDFMLFHWSPIERRKSIARLGLVPGKMSIERIWRPPYIAFARTPSLAWALSGMRRDYGTPHQQWDLWFTWAFSHGGMEMLPFDNGDPKEYRIYQRILKSDLWYIGTRTQLGDKEPI